LNVKILILKVKIKELTESVWISMRTDPEIKDLPFITKQGKNYELWEDSDWFEELSDKERLDWDGWVSLKTLI
jgi:hypothetical protein